jgi:hypothetical protein
LFAQLVKCYYYYFYENCFSFRFHFVYFSRAFFSSLNNSSIISPRGCFFRLVLKKTFSKVTKITRERWRDKQIKAAAAAAVPFISLSALRSLKVNIGVGPKTVDN